MRAMVLGVSGVMFFTWFLAGCCTPRSGCNVEADPTARYQVRPAEYRRAMSERATAKATQEATQPASTQPAALQVLVLSGGGSNGSFGAGFLAGWSQSGQRPKFDVVTGVSVGAILATGAL